MSKGEVTDGALGGQAPVLQRGALARQAPRGGVRVGRMVFDVTRLHCSAVQNESCGFVYSSGTCPVSPRSPRGPIQRASSAAARRAIGIAERAAEPRMPGRLHSSGECPRAGPAGRACAVAIAGSPAHAGPPGRRTLMTWPTARIRHRAHSARPHDQGRRASGASKADEFAPSSGRPAGIARRRAGPLPRGGCRPAGHAERWRKLMTEVSPAALASGAAVAAGSADGPWSAALTWGADLGAAMPGGTAAGRGGSARRDCPARLPGATARRGRRTEEVARARRPGRADAAVPRGRGVPGGGGCIH